MWEVWSVGVRSARSEGVGARSSECWCEAFRCEEYGCGGVGMRSMRKVKCGYVRYVWALV